MYSQYVCSLGIEPTTFALLMQCSTTGIKETARTMGRSEVITNVSSAARYTQQMNILEDMFVVRVL